MASAAALADQAASTVEAIRKQLFRKRKTSGRALPEVSEVYHKVVLRLLRDYAAKKFDGHAKGRNAEGTLDNGKRHAELAACTAKQKKK
jgi:hypothetical protein